MPAMDVVLVNPSNKKTMFGKLSDLSASEPPLWTGLIAGFLRDKGYSVAVIDADALNWGPDEAMAKIEEYNPKLIGVGAVGANPSASSTPKMPAARALLKLIRDKRPDSKTVLYGIHPASLPEQTLREEPVDFVIRGDAFFPMTELIRQIKGDSLTDDPKIQGLWYLKKDELIGNGWAKQEQDLDKLPFVAWDLLPMDKYRAHTWHCYGHIDQRSPYAIIYTSLGCIFNCSYCNIHDLYGEKPGMRFRSPQNVVDEIDLLVKNYGVRNIKFLDELFVMGVKEKYNQRMHEICDLLIERDYNLNIWAYARIDTVNEEILKKLKKAGINWICYGIEGGNKKIRDKVSKGQFDDGGIDRAIKMTYDAGIHIIGNFMFGLPNDDLNSMQDTLDLAKRVNCEYANFYVTMAYPGSQLYGEALEKGLRLPDSWTSYSQYSPDIVPMPTNHLSPEEVLKFRDNAFNEYHNDAKYQNMIKEKFGQETLDHIRGMLSISLKRNILQKADAGASA